MDKLAASSFGRVITVSSVYYEIAEANWDFVVGKERVTDLIEIYGRSKLANILFTNELARRLHGEYSFLLYMYVLANLSKWVVGRA